MIVIGQSLYNHHVFPDYASAFAFDPSYVSSTPSTDMLLEQMDTTYLGNRINHALISAINNPLLLLQHRYVFINANYSIQATGMDTITESTDVCTALRYIILS
jgi:hypothetical protein